MNKLNQWMARPGLSLVVLAYIAFVALGMPDGLFGVALPSIRADFGVPVDGVGIYFIAGTAGYMLSSFSSGWLGARLGIGRMLALSCALTGTVLIGYTLAPMWGVMVALAVAAGLGAGAIDAGLNTYVAAHFGEGTMQWLHASYGIGITLGPIIMTAALTTLNAWRAGYVTVGVFQWALAAGFALTLAMWTRPVGKAGEAQPMRLTDYKTPVSETLRQGRVWLSVLLFFVYTGAEVTLGVWAYTLLTEGRGIAPAAAGLWAGSYWAMFTVGRMLAGVYTRRVSTDRLVLGSLAAALAGAGLLWWNPAPVVNLAAVGIIGLAIAPVFPALVSGTRQRVGERLAANTIGMQVAGAGLGVALLPAVAGLLASRFTLEVIPVWLAVLLALMFALYGVALLNKPKSP